MVIWPPAESIREQREIFLKSVYEKYCVMIDCTEVFTERRKSSAQAVTWSDYKHPYTFKCLVGITPSGFISFLCSCYGGRASDRFITRDNGFYYLLERDDGVMAERGFQVQEDLLLHFCRLVVPPGARVKSQMTKFEVRKTKEVANLLIQFLCCIVQFEAKTYKIQRKGFAEVTGNFHYKLAD